MCFTNSKPSACNKMSEDDENSHHENERWEAGGHVVATVADYSEHSQ